MGEIATKIFIGFIGAAIALILRELLENSKKIKYRKKIISLCREHLEKIRKDLKSHINIENDKAIFNETTYNEAIVGHFLYDIITTNIDKFDDINSIKKTINFFHHYKINMSHIRTRLDESSRKMAPLTKGTFNNLVQYLEESIAELKNL